MSELRTLETLQFDNTFARLPEVFYAKVTPTPLKSPFLVAFNPDAAALLDLELEEARRPEFAGCLAGHYLPPGSEPLAMVCRPSVRRLRLAPRRRPRNLDRRGPQQP